MENVTIRSSRPAAPPGSVCPCRHTIQTTQPKKYYTGCSKKNAVATQDVNIQTSDPKVIMDMDAQKV